MTLLLVPGFASVQTGTFADTTNITEQATVKTKAKIIKINKLIDAMYKKDKNKIKAILNILIKYQWKLNWQNRILVNELIIHINYLIENDWKWTITIEWGNSVNTTVIKKPVSKQKVNHVYVTKWQDYNWNTINDSFSRSKRFLQNDVYNGDIVKMNTFYCWCDYNDNKYVDKDSCWFENDWRYEKRSKKIEWEHIVPAHAFWQSFSEWNEWHEDCVDSKWREFKWRSCAEKVNKEYRYMQADIYNLVPAIWSINALRSNYSFSIIEWEKRKFWTCDMEIENNKAEPKEDIRWDIARIYAYMNLVYPWKWIIWEQRKRLFNQWNANDPIDKNECNTYIKKKKIQWNVNPIIDKKCKEILNIKNK